MKKLKILLLIILFFLVGLSGGFFGGIIFPGIIARSSFLSSIELLNKAAGNITIIREERSETIIDKADAPARAAEKVKSGIVIIERQRRMQTISSSSAVAVTSDGWILAPSSLAQGIVAASQDKFFIILPGEQILAELVKTDNVSQVALFSVKDRKFYTPEFSSRNDVSLGDNVFMLSAFEDETIESHIELGYVSKVTASDIGFNSSFGAESFSGGAVFTTEGKLISFSVNNTKSGATFISSEKINEFMSSARQ